MCGVGQKIKTPCYIPSAPELGENGKFYWEFFTGNCHKIWKFRYFLEFRNSLHIILYLTVSLFYLCKFIPLFIFSF